MDRPPDSKRNPPPPGLSEVERAISVLQGRHPEHERMRRETEESKADRAAVHHAEHAVAARRGLTRRLKIGAVVMIGIIALFVIASSVRHETTRQAALDAAAAPFVAQGFTPVETSSRGDPTQLHADVDPGCVLVTSPKPAAVKVTHPGGVLEGMAPLLTCLCEPAKVSVSTTKEAGGLVLLRTNAASLGGSRAFGFLPFKVATLGTTDQVCAEASLDGWIDAKKWLVLQPDEKWLTAKPERKSLVDAGFTAAAVVKADSAFGVIEIPAKTCALFVDESGTAKTSLRLKGNSLALGPATGTIAWCTQAGGIVTAQRDGKSDLTILFAPAEKAGGLLGVREAAEKAGVGISAMTVPASDRDWIAKLPLVASWIPESLITTGITNTDDDKESRIAVLSVEKPGVLVSESGEGVFSFCDPPLNESTTGSLCFFSGPQKWKVEGDNVAGLARAKTPFWLFGFQNVGEPAALKRETQLVTLARRLRRKGYEPTTIEAVTETDKGAEVLGRANEDGVVAIVLAPTEPWAFPLSDAGHPWTLDGEPRVVPIKPLERIVLVPAPKTKLPAKASRRTVVFRHHV